MSKWNAKASEEVQQASEDLQGGQGQGRDKAGRQGGAPGGRGQGGRQGGVQQGGRGQGGRQGGVSGGRGQGGGQGGGQRGGALREPMEAAREFVKAKKYDEAIKAFEAILDINPDAVQAYTGLGNVYSAKGDYENALEYYAGALHIKEDLVPALMMSAVAYLKMEQTDKALEKFKAALKIRPDLEKAHVGIARLYAKQDDIAKAINAAKEGLKYNPQSEEARLVLATLYLKDGDTEAALKQLHNAIAHDAQSWKAYLRLGRLYAEQNDYRSTVDALKKCIDLNPKVPVSIYNLLAKAYSNTGHHSLALKEFDAVLQANPDFATAKIGKAKVYMEQEKYADAKKILNDLSKNDKVLTNVDLMLAEIMILEGHYDLAIAQYGAVLLKNPKLSEKHSELAEIKVVEGNEEGAAKAFKNAFDSLDTLLDVVGR